MSCNPVSYFPNKVDEMIFFQDNNLGNVEVMNHYNELITQGKYTEANDYISPQEGIYGFFADFFNLIENRIYNTQEYLLSKPQKKQPVIYYDEEEHYSINDLHVFAYIEEEDIPINCFHIFTDTDEDEDLSLVRLFEDENSNEDGESINIMHVFADCYAEIEEDFSSIVLFSDNDEQEFLENLYIFTGEEEPPPNADIDTIWI